MYLDGWKAVTIHADRMPWDLAARRPFEDDVWELYHLDEDFSEANDLADEQPDKLEELKAAWDEEAFKYNVYPLHDDVLARLTNVVKQFAPIRDEYVYYAPGAIRISEPYSPPVKNRSHSITAYADLSDGASGVLVAAGGIYGGYALFVKDGLLVYEYNAYNEDRYQVRSSSRLPAGEVELRAVYEAGENLTATVTLFVNDEQVGQGEIGRSIPGTYSLSETFDVGQDTGTPVSRDYDREESVFSGTLDRVVIRIED